MRKGKASLGGGRFNDQTTTEDPRKKASRSKTKGKISVK